MTTKKLMLILYIGASGQADALREHSTADGWEVFHPKEVLEALGMYITYLPDVVIIEDSTENTFSYEIFMHLRSIKAENMLILTDHPTTWELPANTQIRTLPQPSSIQDIIEAVHQATSAPHHHPLL